MLTFLFQFVLLALVVLSFVLVVGVPVAYASPQIWNQSKSLIFVGSGLWVALVIAVGVLNFLVV
ncbi:MAG: photosystem II reaction center protein PsbZ [Microcoleaceae cyanobacterium MO_207.B10]|nr:photosystem II reaction center protein PsbZ [Microcoleaceae cyanobacterium MO_207.B10]